MTFNRDQTEQDVEIIIGDDLKYELAEDFQVRLSSNKAEKMLVPSTAIVTILSDDGTCDKQKK